MWLDNQSDQDPYNRKSGNAPTNDASVGAGGGGAPAAGGTGAPSGSNPSTFSPVQPNKTQNFASVQDYLKGNQQQSQDLSAKFNTDLGNTFDSSKSAIDSAAGNVKNQANAAAQYDPNIVKSSFEDPDATLNDSNKLSGFLKQWNGNYSGPSSFESTTDFGTAANAANNAQQKAEQVKTAGGREQILQDDFGVYGQGNKGLDQVLLQNSPDFASTQQYAPKLDSLQGYLKSNSNDINNGTISQAKNDVAANAERAKSEFGAGVKGFQNDVNQRAMSGIDPNNLGMWNDVSSAYAHQPGFALPTTNPGVDIARYLQATPEDRAKDASLARLSGTKSDLFPTTAQTPDLSQLQAILDSLKKK